MPAVASPSADVTAKELNSAGIKKAQAAPHTLVNGGDPKTLSQLKSLVKKA